MSTKHIPAARDRVQGNLHNRLSTRRAVIRYGSPVTMRSILQQRSRRYWPSSAEF